MQLRKIFHKTSISYPPSDMHTYMCVSGGGGGGGGKKC